MSRVLIVEDERWLGDAYRRRLVAAGHDVRLCGDGQAAIDLLDEWRPELVVLDIMLPGGNGIQLLHEMASYADLMDVKVIICSAALPQEVLAGGLEHYGVVKAMDKSVMRLDDLVNAVGSVV